MRVRCVPFTKHHLPQIQKVRIRLRTSKKGDSAVGKGRKKHDDYLEALNLLGKDLARRARSKCELSEQSGSLRAFDLVGPDSEPSLEHVVLVSETVRNHLEGHLSSRDEMRYLETAVWNQEFAVRKACVRILRQIKDAWADEAIANAESMGAPLNE